MVIDLQNIISLNEEQIAVLKDTMRELEASLARELEFNESNRQLNKEYLVNILRNFLMTKEASEHSKLVPVLCSILHFLPDETKIIWYLLVHCIVIIQSIIKILQMPFLS
jgi:hypothetical protein